jgi:hypothetical protein
MIIQVYLQAYLENDRRKRGEGNKHYQTNDCNGDKSPKKTDL